MASSSTDTTGLSTFLITLRTCFITFMALLIIAGNALFIIVAHRIPNLPDSTKVLMKTLAAYDMLVGVLASLSIIASAMDKWPFGQVLCEIYMMAIFVIYMMTNITIVLLNVERYIAVMKPYKFPRWCTRRRMITLVIIASIFCLLLNSALKFLLGISAQYFPTSAICIFQENSKVASITGLLSGDVIPSTIMTCVYYRLIRISRQHQLRNNGVNNIYDNKALKTFLAVTLTYSVCFTPLMVAKTVQAFTGESNPSWLEFGTVWLAVFNSICNVLIYCLFNRSFRQIAKRAVFQIIPCHRQSVAPVNI